MLTEIERQLIRDQETLRKEIREEISPKRDQVKSNKLWEFLNSTFGIWLLSSVFLSGLTTIISKQIALADEEQKQHVIELENKNRQKEIIDRLNIEISHRLSTSLTRLHNVSISEKFKTANKKINSHSDGHIKSIRDALKPLSAPTTDVDPPLYPDFKKFSGIALIAELRRYSPDGEKQNLKQIIAETSGLIADILSEKKDFSQTSASDVASDLIKKMQHEAWKNGFAYTDCKPEVPFC